MTNMISGVLEPATLEIEAVDPEDAKTRSLSGNFSAWSFELPTVTCC